MKKLIHIFVFILASMPSMSLTGSEETEQFKLGWWNQKSFNGFLMLESMYRSQETILKSGKKEKPQSLLFNGELNLHSNSYIWQPGFIKMDLDLGYSPGTRRDNYLVIPDRSETYTAEKLKISTTFFDQRPLKFHFNVNWNHNFINREYTSNVESYNRDYGLGFSFRNTYAPLNIHYDHSRWEQKELQTGRLFKNRQQTLRSETSKSFGKNDDHRLLVSYNDFSRQYSGNFTVRNYLSSFRLTDNFYFDAKKESSINSFVWFHNQKGNNDYERLQVNERFKVKLTKNLKTTGHYSFTNFRQHRLDSRQHQLQGKIRHSLYLSLDSYAFMEYSDFDQTTLDETMFKRGLGIDYHKKIHGGTLQIKYEYSMRSDKQGSDPRRISVLKEEYALRDDNIVLLSNPFINTSSIVITNSNGNIIFQENIDYILIERGDYLEIQRLPGGQISDGQIIYVDYNTVEPISFEYDAINQNAFLSVSMLGNLLETYFRYFDQSSENVVHSRNLVIKNIVQRTSGFRISHSFISTGFEYDEYETNIIPYISRRYYLKINHNFSKFLRTYISANARNLLIKNENKSQNFRDISSQMIYMLTPVSYLKLEGGYRFQKGRGLNLTLFNFRSEYSTRIRALVLKAGIENYSRDFSGEKVIYTGGYLRVERHF